MISFSLSSKHHNHVIGLILLSWIVQSSAFLPTFSQQRICSTTISRTQAINLHTFYHSASCPRIFGLGATLPLLSELEHSEGSLEDEEEDDDDTLTYRLNLELARLANQCARRGRAGKSRSRRHPALVALQILQKNMTHPDTVAYNSVLKAFAKSSPASLSDGTIRQDAAEWAQSLLEEMIQTHAEQSSRQQQWYQRRGQGTLEDGNDDDDDHHDDEHNNYGPPRIYVKPNVRSFSTVMDAWSRTGNVDQTLEVLDQLETRYEQEQDGALQPNLVCYNTVLSAYAKSKGGQTAAQDCQLFLEQMPVRPDIISYNCVLHSWARSGASIAGERAEAILRQMPIPAETRTYATVMDAWSRTGEPEKAHGLLKELKDLYETTNNPKQKPNTVCYSTVIHAYAMSKLPLKAQIAFDLLQEMRLHNDTSVMPNLVTYNSVLNACATSSPLLYSDDINDVTTASTSSSSKEEEGSTRACLQGMVQSLYQHLIAVPAEPLSDSQSKPPSQRLAPDHFTFGTVLKACANNLFWDCPAFGREVFEEAAKRGQVSLGVLVQLRQAVSPQIFDQLVPRKAYDSARRQFNLQYIPDEWKRNVRERRSS